MTENDEKNVRRLGKRDKKNKLPRAGSLFPPEEPTPEPDPMPSALDLDKLSLPDSDADALETLAKMDNAFRPPVITPSEERYPPLAPVDAPRPVPVAAEETQQPQQPAKRGSCFYNLVTVLALLGSCASVVWIATIWVDPQTALNPFPPATRFVQVTATPGDPAQVLPTPDESGQIFIVITDTPAVTFDTPAPVTESPYPFIVLDPVLYVPNANDFGCNWWSIAGTVTDLNGQALNGYRIRISGDGVNETVFSGAALTFGAGGYELPLIGTPQAADFTVQLFSAQEVALSEPISVQTRADCEGNVTIVNFIQNR